MNELTQTSHEWILKNSMESSAAGWTATQQRRNIQKSTMPSKSYQVVAGNSPFYRRYVRMSSPPKKPDHDAQMPQEWMSSHGTQFKNSSKLICPELSLSINSWRNGGRFSYGKSQPDV